MPDYQGINQSGSGGGSSRPPPPALSDVIFSGNQANGSIIELQSLKFTKGSTITQNVTSGNLSMSNLETENLITKNINVTSGNLSIINLETANLVTENINGKSGTINFNKTVVKQIVINDNDISIPTDPVNKNYVDSNLLEIDNNLLEIKNNLLEINNYLSALSAGYIITNQDTKQNIKFKEGIVVYL